MKILETERLLLREISVKEAGFILELYSSPNFIKYIGDRKLRTLNDAENYIKEKFLPQFAGLGFGNYLITQKSDGQNIGAVGIFVREGLETPDIGFSFLEQFEGKGFGYEASSLLINTGFTEFGLEKIAAFTTPENILSQKLIEKLGLKYIKIIQFGDDPEELRYYELSKNDWEIAAREKLNRKI